LAVSEDAGAPTLQAIELRPFLPARDFKQSQRFYESLGFQVSLLSAEIAEVVLGERQSFLLQDFYRQALAENLMMQLQVRNLDDWWRRIEAAGLPRAYGVKAPKAPRDESWGQRVAYVWDPAGVLWHIAE
jgi:catechol 2,3-dioxygenase-like lactoylglutathione lyase family enzyme